MTDQIVYGCGCVNAPHAPSGVLRSVSKCKMHRKEQRSPDTLGQTYYEELGAIVDGIPQSAAYHRQLVEAISHFPWSKDPLNSYAVEVGCGCSMYAADLLRSGYRYTGIDPSEWAAKWTASTYNVDVSVGSIESLWHDGVWSVSTWWDLILAAHVIEHLEDAPMAIVGLANLLKPGGELWIIVPDDSDPVNPDHIWFHTPETLRSCIESAGLVVEKLAVRRYVKHEQFIYVRARKPE